MFLGEILPVQIIYQGKTKRCEPKFKFPSSFYDTHTHNHCPNTLTSVPFFEKILPPYMKSVQDSINNPKHKALLISDVFRAQHTQTLKDLLTANNCILQKVPASLTYHLQPLDISINGLTKKFMRISMKIGMRKT